MFEKIKERYEKYYITDTQLDRYVELSVISGEQAEEIRTGRKMEKNTGGGGVLTLIFESPFRLVGR